jgi:curved DNA-binding protein CbpA
MEPKWKKMNEYELLELDSTASDEEIKQAWEILRIAWHPDRFPEKYSVNVTERFQAIKQAYETLIDPISRKRLNLSLGFCNIEDDNYSYQPQFEFAEQLVPANWKHLARWAKDEDKLNNASRNFAYNIADKYLEKSRQLTERQLEWAKKIWNEAINEGFDPGDDEA